MIKSGFFMEKPLFLGAFFHTYKIVLLSIELNVVNL